MIIRRLIALLVLCAPACAPIVSHGPRPERGLQGTLTLGVPRQLCDSSCGLSLTPQYGFGLRYGRPAEDGRAGYSVASTFSLALVSTDMDVYVQAPTTPEWAAGGGMLVSPTYVMPYVQLGRMRSDGGGLYTTQGFAWLAERYSHLGLVDEATEQVTPRYWAPTIAYRLPNRSGAVHLYVSGAFGSMGREHSWSSPELRPLDRGPVRVVMAGLALETRIDTPVLLGPPPRPRGP